MVNVKLPAGSYVVAVSGGVDSMVLLDILRRQPSVKLLVAHANHGIRGDSDVDEELVHHYAMSHNIEFISGALNLGSGVSEEKARNARYKFLRRCRKQFKAKFIITAQHQDDMVETVIINLLRGTGWRGLAPFVNKKDVLRPLLNYRKAELIDYAQEHNVPWHEDSTNQDQKYLRNYVRQSLLPRLEQNDANFCSRLLRLIRKQQLLRRTIQKELDGLLYDPPNKLPMANRHHLIMVPPAVAYELLQQLITNTTGSSLLKPQANALLIFAKTAKAGKTMPIAKHWQVRCTARQLIVERRNLMLS
jgi:tRNA(Ile)-lysidine synthase